MRASGNWKGEWGGGNCSWMESKVLNGLNILVKHLTITWTSQTVMIGYWQKYPGMVPKGGQPTKMNPETNYWNPKKSKWDIY